MEELREGQREWECERCDRDCEMFAANSESFHKHCCWLIFFSFAMRKAKYLCFFFIYAHRYIHKSTFYIWTCIYTYTCMHIFVCTHLSMCTNCFRLTCCLLLRFSLSSSSSAWPTCQRHLYAILDCLRTPLAIFSCLLWPFQLTLAVMLAIIRKLHLWALRFKAEMVY